VRAALAEEAADVGRFLGHTTTLKVSTAER
jgi:hypothetical protein